MKKLVLGLLALMSFAACATDIDQNDYARSCVSTAECLLILQGDPCSCSCDFGSINASDIGRYRQDSEDECSVDCAPCPTTAVACIDGVCTATPADTSS